MARKNLVVSVSFGTGPFDTPSWTDISTRVRSASWTWGRHRDEGDWPQGTAQVELYNHDRLFDPQNTSGTHFGDLLPRVPFRFQTAAGEDLFYGFVDDGWEQTYQHPEDGYCTVRLVDLLAVLEGVTLPGVFEHALLDLAPVGLWMMNGASEASGVVDLSGSGNHGEVIGSVTFGQTPVAPGHSQSALFEGSIDTPAFIDLGRSQVVPYLFDVATADVTVVATIRARNIADVLNFRVVFIQAVGNVANAISHYMIAVHDDGHAILQLGLGPSAGAGTFKHPTLVGDGRDHLIIGQADGTDDDRRGLAVDTVDLDDTTDSIPFANTNGAGIGGHRGILNLDCWDGWIGTVATYDFSMTTSERQQIIDGYSLLSGQRSDEQIDWVLDRVGVPAGIRNLDEGRSIMGPLDSAGRDALELIRQLTRTEHGAFYVDHADAGNLRFVERYAPWLATRSTVSQATFSDDPANSTALRVEPGSLVVEANGIRTVVNQATVTWTGGKATATADLSMSTYGPRGRTVDTVATSPHQALSLAQWIVTLNADPVARIRGFGLNPAGAEDAFDAAVDLRPYDLVTFRSQPGVTGSVVTRNLLIEGITHTVDDGREWKTTFSTVETPADVLTPFILGTSELDGPDVLAY